MSPVIKVFHECFFTPSPYRAVLGLSEPDVNTHTLPPPRLSALMTEHISLTHKTGLCTSTWHRSMPPKAKQLNKPKN